VSEWQKCPEQPANGWALVAAPLGWGVKIAYAAKDRDEPGPTCPIWDLSEAELEWLLQMARGEAPDGPR